MVDGDDIHECDDDQSVMMMVVMIIIIIMILIMMMVMALCLMMITMIAALMTKNAAWHCGSQQQTLSCEPSTRPASTIS